MRGAAGCRCRSPIKAPSIAVIVPLLNEVERLPAFIEMLGTLDADETVVVDGGSTDGSRAILQQSGLNWLESEPGRARQMNSGAAHCESDILIFIHVDTSISSSDIYAVCETMRDESTVGGRFDIRLSGRHPAFRLIEWSINTRSRLTRISTGDQCQFVRRKVFEEIGCFPEQPLMEDIEFSARLKRHGRIECLRDKVTTSSRRWQQHGILRTVLMMWKLRLYYWLGVAPERLAAIYRDAR